MNVTGIYLNLLEINLRFSEVVKLDLKKIVKGNYRMLLQNMM